MKPSQSKNRIANGRPYVIVEIGDKVFFGGDIQQFFLVDRMENERPFCGDVDILQLHKDSKILPIVFTNNEFITNDK